ncbi:hypothetical protein ACT7DF_26115 [Bacillus cereus]
MKVETKDRFGNKKVTEVPVEVTYGDSLVYQGVSDVTRSIVTLNHAERNYMQHLQMRRFIIAL